MTAFRDSLNQYSNEEMRKLGKLPIFESLQRKYGNIRKATEGELSDAFMRTPFSDIESALGINIEINDMQLV